MWSSEACDYRKNADGSLALSLEKPHERLAFKGHTGVLRQDPAVADASSSHQNAALFPQWKRLQKVWRIAAE